MKTLRIPTRYKRQLSRLKKDECFWVYDSLMKLASGENVKQPDTMAGDILELIWRDSIQMEKKGRDPNIDNVGVYSPTMSPTVSNTEGKRKEGKRKESEFDKTLREYKKMRARVGRGMTDLAVTRLISKLKKLSPDESVQIKIMLQSIDHSWKDVYALKVDAENIDWKNLTLEEAREILKDDKMAHKLEVNNPELYFQAQ